MLHAGLDLSRKWLDYCLLDEQGGRVEVGAAPPDGDGLRGFARGVEDRHGPVLVRAAIESTNSARFVHDALERCGWEVEVADAQNSRSARSRPRRDLRAAGNIEHLRQSRRAALIARPAVVPARIVHGLA